MYINIAINNKEIYLPFGLVSISLKLLLYASDTYSKSNNKEMKEKKTSKKGKKKQFSDDVFLLSQSSLILFVLRWMRLPLLFCGSVYDTVGQPSVATVADFEQTLCTQRRLQPPQFEVSIRKLYAYRSLRKREEKTIWSYVRPKAESSFVRNLVCFVQP